MAVNFTIPAAKIRTSAIFANSGDVLSDSRAIIMGRTRIFKNVKTRPLASFPQYTCPSPGITSENTIASQACLLFVMFVFDSTIYGSSAQNIHYHKC